MERSRGGLGSAERVWASASPAAGVRGDAGAACDEDAFVELVYVASCLSYVFFYIVRVICEVRC